MPENVTLVKLNAILQYAMGWLGGHLHEYVIGRLHYGVPDENWPSLDPVIDERRMRLNTLVEHGARRFTYLYDFGDNWQHTVKIEDVVMPPNKGLRIRCISGENACPPEDVGGADAYFDFLAAITDPNHEEHASMLRWISGSFFKGLVIRDANNVNAPRTPLLLVGSGRTPGYLKNLDHCREFS